ncbi:hybrid sensor histidine kinase/response regulator [Chromobacterium violaceum]|uniref:hybrid sensor histidine kinase/response regulator n=1 Tax=Chromobacterium violaceum TaxID=536 RepID=UPI00143DE25B|nr:hybrid sensor histidine kinase/response regulator [Chromobacterium violaceum]MBX9265622.1 hybrid sensor histidine kinase/response regulator [Chromobacterium violaceum]MCD0493102.1 hybrid sensor histidine kinase/response regulator [Chromobacterium violaceum]QIY77945.1 response regulator [Chromobacterium violaceum]
MTRYFRLVFRSVGGIERAFLALSLLATVIISFTLYAAVIKRPITNKVSDLYWMAAQMQLTFNRLEMDVWRYRAGQITREETDKSYAIAYSKYRMFTRPSAVNTDLEKIEGFDQIKALLARIFQHPPRQWTQQDALELSRDMEEMRPLLADYGVKARYAENSLVAQQLRMVERHQTMYLLGLMCWLAFLGIFWFVLHRLAEIRRHSLQQQQVLEREQAARAALVQTELARDTFLATISHEIRSPLQSIQTCTELLEYSIPPDNPGYGYLSRLKQSNAYLLAQVRDIMDISALKNHQLALEPATTDIEELVACVVAVHQGNAEAKGLALTVSVPPMPLLWLDGNRLRQIMWNLLSNAIRYTDQGGIRLELEYRPRNLVLSVADTGVGIPEDIRVQLFRPFTRGKTRRPGSSGLGLAIVHELVTLFGGQIEIDSQEGRGSTFTLSLPVQEASTPEDCDGAGYGQGRILLLDDDDPIRESYSALLQENGYSVSSFATVNDAAAQVVRHRFDILLIDLQVGTASGYEVAEAARRFGPNRNTPIIGMTAFRQEFNDARSALLAGKLEKPFSFAQLEQLLSLHLPRNNTGTPAQA